MKLIQTIGFTVTGILICTALLISVGKAQEIPAGVNYKTTTDEINDKAKLVLEKAFAEKSDSVDLDKTFGSVVVCGPLLWDAIKEAGGEKFSGAAPMILVINASKPIRKEGRGISKPEQKKLLWKLVLEKVKGDHRVSVRKAKAGEISYYWATIPFDIEEPFLIVDLDKVSILVNFSLKNGEPRIFWMDIVGDLKSLR